MSISSAVVQRSAELSRRKQSIITATAKKLR
jgi:hypothetical protein